MVQAAGKYAQIRPAQQSQWVVEASRLLLAGATIKLQMAVVKAEEHVYDGGNPSQERALLIMLYDDNKRQLVRLSEQKEI